MHHCCANVYVRRGLTISVAVIVAMIVAMIVTVIMIVIVIVAVIVIVIVIVSVAFVVVAMLFIMLVLMAMFYTMLFLFFMLLMRIFILILCSNIQGNGIIFIWQGSKFNYIVIWILVQLCFVLNCFAYTCIIILGVAIILVV
jgi:hypothetical protein